AGFATSGFTHDRHQLTIATLDECLRTPKVFQLRVAADEARKASTHGRLESRPGRAGARGLVHVDPVPQALYRHRPEGPHGDVAFDEIEGRRRQHDVSQARAP